MLDDLFGGIFDFNGDGHTDFGEEMLGLAIIDDMTKSEQKPEISSGYLSDDYDGDIGTSAYSSNVSSSDDSEEEIEERREEIESKKDDLENELFDLSFEEPDFDDFDAHEEWSEKVSDLESKISELDDELFELDLL